MNENNILEMSPENSGLGKVEIAPEVIEVIAGILCFGSRRGCANARKLRYRSGRKAW